MRCTDADAAWMITDGPRPGLVATMPGPPGDVPSLRGTAGQLLLWLYGRVRLDTNEVDTAAPGLIGRFRGTSYTD